MGWLPESASTYASDIDLGFWVITVIVGIAFVVVEAALVLFLVRYRARPGRRAAYIHGNTTAEVIWTAVPAITVVAIGVWSAGLWSEIKGRDNFPADAVHLAIEAKQFEWNVTYPGPDGQLGTEDDFTRRNALEIPVNRPVVVDLTAEDVLHSFFVPAFRIKQDAVPGMTIPVWFEATKTGEFELACAELCGNSHYSMKGRVRVHTAEDYEEWVRSQSSPEAGQ
jgi:cytochrome c oxidase subunit 2